MRKLIGAVLGIIALSAGADQVIITNAVSIRDTWINEVSPDASYGTAKNMRIRGDGGTLEGAVLVWFDVSSIPSGTDVSGSYIRLWNTTVTNVSIPKIKVCSVTSPWDNAVTWTTQPDYDTTAVSTVIPGTITEAGWIDFDVSTLVENWINNPSSNYGVMIMYSPGSIASGVPILYFDTVEKGGATTPRLVVNTAVPEPATIGLFFISSMSVFILRKTKDA